MHCAYKFTGKERDAETGLDYFGHRYFGSDVGRFMRPDDPFADQNQFNPQSWNLYSYVRNNPLINVDPSGRECVSDDKGGWVYSGSGETCEDVKNQNAQYERAHRASSTVRGATNDAELEIAAREEVDEALDAFFGNGPKDIIYPPTDPFVQVFQNSAGMDAINVGVKRDCGASSGKVSVGTWDAFTNTLIDGLAGRAGFQTPQAQMGAFNATYTRGGGRLDVVVTNRITLNSDWFHIPSKLGIKNPLNGMEGTVNQTLFIVAPDPCVP